ADSNIGLDAVLTENPAELDIHALSHCGNRGLGVELDRVDAVDIGLAVASRQLIVEDAAGQGEAVVDSGQDPVRAEAKGRLGSSAGYHGAFEPYPVLLERGLVCPPIETHGQVAVLVGTGGDWR